MPEKVMESTCINGRDRVRIDGIIVLRVENATRIPA